MIRKYNPIKADEKIMSEDLTKQEKTFVDSFTLNRHEERKVVKMMTDCIGKKGQCGLHIVIDDGNTEESHVRWCLENLNKYCPKEDIEVAKEICEYLLRFDDEKRWKLHTKSMTNHWNRKKK